MLHALFCFFVLQFFFENYWISSIVSFVVFLLSNTSYKKDCGCDTNQKPQIDK